jgi:hypothetical protein
VVEEDLGKPASVVVSGAEKQDAPRAIIIHWVTHPDPGKHRKPLAGFAVRSLLYTLLGITHKTVFPFQVGRYYDIGREAVRGRTFAGTQAVKTSA